MSHVYCDSRGVSLSLETRAPARCAAEADGRSDPATRAGRARLSLSRVCCTFWCARTGATSARGASRLATPVSRREYPRSRVCGFGRLSFIATALAEFDRDLTSEHRDYVFFQIYGPYTGNSPPQWVMRDSWLTHTCDITRHSQSSQTPERRGRRNDARPSAAYPLPRARTAHL